MPDGDGCARGDNSLQFRVRNSSAIDMSAVSAGGMARRRADGEECKGYAREMEDGLERGDQRWRSGWESDMISAKLSRLHDDV